MQSAHDDDVLLEARLVLMNPYSVWTSTDM